MQLFGDLDTLSFIGIRRLDWIGRVKGMESGSNVIQVFHNNPRGSRLIGGPKTDGRIVYRQMLINGKLKTGKRGQKQCGLGEVH